ncbi:MAG: hypothetical protein ABWX74_14580 [Aeromicrobium sp.]
MTSDRDRPAEPIEATAYSEVDGVETWDLTGTPSDEAFGIEGASTAVYETQEPRPVRIVLEGRTVETDTDLVDFRRGGSGDYTFRVSTPQLAADPLVAEYRSVLGQLGLGEASVDELDRQVAAAPADQSEKITVGSGDETAVVGPWSVAASATFTPLAGLGRVVLAGITPRS